MFRIMLRVCLMLVLSMGFVAQGMAASSLVWFAGRGLVTGKAEGPLSEVVWGGAPLLRLDSKGLLAIDTVAKTIQLIDQEGVVKTLVGQADVQGLDHAGGTSDEPWFDPRDVVRGPDQRLYIADSKNFAVRVVDQAGKVSTLPVDWAALGADVDTDYCLPKSLTFDAQGRLWVGLSNTQVMLIVDRDGHAKAWRPKTHEGLEMIRLTSDAQGQVWGLTRNSIGRVKDGGIFEVVASMRADTEDSPVAYRVAPPDDGPVAAYIGKIPFLGLEVLSPGSSSEKRPLVFQSFAIDEHGDVYVREYQHIYRFSVKNQAWETLLTDSKELKWRDFGSIVVMNSNVLVSDEEGVQYLASSGQLEHYANLFDKPSHVAGGTALKRVNLNGIEGPTLLQADGSILLLNRLDHVIHQVDAQGKVHTWAGHSDEEGDRNGPRLNARFHYPSDMVQDKAGNVYVADSGNGLIRKISPDGMVSVVAGGGPTQERVDGVGTEARFWRTRRLALDESRNRLYILDDCPYALCSSEAVLRQLDLASGQVTTPVPETSILIQVNVETVMSLMENRLFPAQYYEDIAVDANGSLIALSRDLGSSIVWRIHPESGHHDLLFAVPYMEQESMNEDKTSETQKDDSQPWKGPVSIEADSFGNVYVSDQDSHVIVRINSAGIAGVIAGQLGKHGVLEGDLPGVLDTPKALTRTPDGDLMIVLAGKGLMLLKQAHLAPIQQTIPNILQR
jgi:DNA-binding beta-propeller fold protein YncE